MTEDAARIEAIRRFNRFYTRTIGVLREGLLESRFSLTQARVLYELAHRQQPTASDLGRELGLDAGYLSRLLRGFVKDGLVVRTRSAEDARQSHLALTEDGATAFAELDAKSRAEVGDLLARLAPADRGRLVGAMTAIQEILDPASIKDLPAYILRPHQPGDMGWVIQRHGALYASEYGWDETFEAMVAKIAAKFIDEFNPRRERCWIAERHGVQVGSAFIVDVDETTAKLRMLIVDPSARGLGIGRRLVQECIRFARQTGYQRIELWTNDILLAARQIYVDAGFRLTHSEAHHSFGKDLVGETWELLL